MDSTYKNTCRISSSRAHPLPCATHPTTPCCTLLGLMFSAIHLLVLSAAPKLDGLRGHSPGCICDLRSSQCPLASILSLQRVTVQPSVLHSLGMIFAVVFNQTQNTHSQSFISYSQITIGILCPGHCPFWSVSRGLMVAIVRLSVTSFLRICSEPACHFLGHSSGSQATCSEDQLDFNRGSFWVQHDRLKKHSMRQTDMRFPCSPSVGPRSNSQSQTRSKMTTLPPKLEISSPRAIQGQKLWGNLAVQLERVWLERGQAGYRGPWFSLEPSLSP